MSTALKPADLPDLFRSFQQNVRSGTLKLEGGDGRVKYVYFNRGLVEMLKASRSRTLLGKALLKRRKITEPQLTAALDRQKAARQPLRLGQILIGMGVVTETDVQHALAYQVAEEVFELFAWSSIKSEFFRGEPPLDIFEQEDLQSRVSLKPEDLARQADKRSAELESIRRTISSFNDVYAPTAQAERFTRAGLNDGQTEREVLSCCDGYRDVDELLDQVRAPDLAALRVLAKMVVEGDVAAIDPARLVQIGAELEEAQDFVRARRRYARAEELGHQDFDLPRKIGQLDEALGNMASACERYVAYAERCEQAGYPDVAGATLARVVELDPGRREARQRYAALLARSGDAPGAAREYERLFTDLPADAPVEERIRLITAILAVDPDKLELKEQAAKLWLDSGDPAQAIAEYSELATEVLDRGEDDRAIGFLRKVLEIDPAEVVAHQMLATTLAKQGKKDEAVAEFLKIADGLQASGLATASAQTLVQIYEKVVELQPGHSKARRWLAQAYEGKAEADKARAQYSGMVDELRKGGDKTELLQALEKLVALSPDDRPIALERARLLKELGKEEEARAAFRAIADAATKSKEPEAAAEAYSEVLQANPGDLDAHAALAKVETQKKELDKAERRWAAIFELAFVAGKLDVAEDAVKKALDLESDRPAHRERMARIHLAREKPDEAAKMLVRAAKLAKTEDDYGMARAWTKRALELDAANVEAQELLESLKRGPAPIAAAPIVAAAAAPGAPAPVAPAAPVAPFVPTSGRSLAISITGGSKSNSIEPMRSKRVSGIADKLKQAMAGGEDGAPPAPIPEAAPKQPEVADAAIAKKASSAMNKLRALKGLGGGTPPPELPAFTDTPPAGGAGGAELPHARDAAPTSASDAAAPKPTTISKGPEGPGEVADPALAKKASSAMNKLRALKGLGGGGAPSPPPSDAAPVEAPPPAPVAETPAAPPAPASAPAPAAKGATPKISKGPEAPGEAADPALAKKASSAMSKLRALKGGAGVGAPAPSDAPAPPPAEAAAPAPAPTVAPATNSPVARGPVLPGKISKGPEAPGEVADASLAKKASSAMSRLKALKAAGAGAGSAPPAADTGGDADDARAPEGSEATA